MAGNKHPNLSAPDPDGEFAKMLEAIAEYVKEELSVEMKKTERIRYTIKKTFKDLPEKYKKKSA